MMSADGRFGSWEEAVQWLRGQPDRRDLVLNAYYDDPLIEAAERYRCSDEWRAIRAFIGNRGGAALDIGAGRGIASYALAKDGYRVMALEPDSSDLVGAGAIRRLAEQAALPISICEQYSESLPFPDASFDIVFARAVLHHARDIGLACQEIFRVLKPGGRLVAVREHVISQRADLSAFLDKHPLHKLYGGENAFMLKEYLEALRGADFRVSAVLSPLSSPINLFPQTEDSLRREVCLRLGRLPPVAKLLERIFSLPRLFSMLLRLLSLVDHRPGRLYSFVADKH